MANVSAEDPQRCGNGAAEDIPAGTAGTAGQPVQGRSEVGSCRQEESPADLLCNRRRDQAGPDTRHV